MPKKQPPIVGTKALQLVSNAVINNKAAAERGTVVCVSFLGDWFITYFAYYTRDARLREGGLRRLSYAPSRPTTNQSSYHLHTLGC